MALEWYDWLGIVVAVAIIIALPFLHIAERRQAARDAMKHEELIRHAWQVYGDMLRAARTERSLNPQRNGDTSGE